MEDCISIFLVYHNQQNLHLSISGHPLVCELTIVQAILALL